MYANYIMTRLKHERNILYFYYTKHTKNSSLKEKP